MDKNLTIRNLLSKIEEFKNSSLRSLWIEEFPIKLYTRKSYRIHNKIAYNCIDIASIEIEIQNQGYFTLFISEFIKKYPEENIFVESIMNPAINTVLNKFNFDQYSIEDCKILIKK